MSPSELSQVTVSANADGSVIIHSANNNRLAQKLMDVVQKSQYRDLVEIIYCGQVYAMFTSGKNLHEGLSIDHVINDILLLIH